MKNNLWNYILALGAFVLVGFLALNSSESPLSEEDFSKTDETLIEAIYLANQNGNLRATTQQNKYKEADIIIVDIPLDIDYLNEEPILEFKSFESAIKTLGQQIVPETLIIIETTVPPGTCEKIVIPALEKELYDRQMSINDIYLAHSYERVMPGENYLASITENWRVFSGLNKKSAFVGAFFYAFLISIGEHNFHFGYEFGVLLFPVVIYYLNILLLKQGVKKYFIVFLFGALYSVVFCPIAKNLPFALPFIFAWFLVYDYKGCSENVDIN